MPWVRSHWRNPPRRNNASVGGSVVLVLVGTFVSQSAGLFSKLIPSPKIEINIVTKTTEPPAVVTSNDQEEKQPLPVQVQSDPPPEPKPQVQADNINAMRLMNIARNLEKSNKSQAALPYYEQVIAEYPDSKESHLAVKRIDAIKNLFK